jgi:hypothetical protein
MEFCPDVFYELAQRRDFRNGSRAAVVARLMLRPVCLQLRKCRVRPRQLRLVPQADLTRFRYRPLGQLLTIGGSSGVYGCYRSICRRIQNQQIVRIGENRPRKQQQYDG